MNKGILIGVGVVALAAIAIFAFAQGSNRNQTTAPSTSSSQAVPEENQTEPQDEMIAEEENVIVYTNAGFSPTTLTVPAGTAVTFRNEGTAQMWVASDPHPVHTGLSGFDQLRGVLNGGTYTFTFQSTGSYSFHNHLNPNHTGTIIVE